MSVSIGWRPNDPKSITYIEGASSFLKAIENAFGEAPITLSDIDVSTLRGIESCGFSGARELIEAIYDKDSIIVEAIY